MSDFGNRTRNIESIYPEKAYFAILLVMVTTIIKNLDLFESDFKDQTS